MSARTLGSRHRFLRCLMLRVGTVIAIDEGPL